ncbi:hypothetical protein OAO65_02105, partial [Flavobacteriales bacterium]|nr:hypothetical protein [Flavobacteriales bacterium]
MMVFRNWLAVAMTLGSMSTAFGQSLSSADDLSLVQSWAQQPNGWNYPLAVSVPSMNPPSEGFPVGIILHG